MKIYSKFALPAILSVLLFACNDNSSKTATVTTDQKDTTVQTKMAKETHYHAKVVPVAELPTQVKISFEKSYPTAAEIEWMQYDPSLELLDDFHPEIDSSYYFVTFNYKDENITNWYDTAGNWVISSTPLLGSAKLPSEVNQVIASKYPDYQIDEIKKENDKNTTIYKVKLRRGEDKVKILFLPNGDVYKSKSKEFN